MRTQARSQEQKAKIANRKERIQKEFKKQLELNTDIPKPGAGTSNDGNTARRFFEDVSLSAAILGVDEQLMANCRVVLQVLACGLPVNADKFKIYCLDVARQYVQLYSWYPLPTSIHVVLIHGHSIIENSVLPIGQMSEDAQEARNKDIKKYLESFSRKSSRENTMSDIFHRLLPSSDPLISSLHKIKPKVGPGLPPEVIELLQPVQTYNTTQVDEGNILESADEDECCANYYNCLF